MNHDNDKEDNDCLESDKNLLPPHVLIKVTGTIVRRRCMGKNLAFANIEVISWLSQAQAHDETKQEEQQIIKNDNKIIKVAFRRMSPSWYTQGDDKSFPIKNSALPHGAKVTMTLYNNCLIEETSSAAHLEVCSWKILTHPHDIAMNYASMKGLSYHEDSSSSSILYSDYAKSRTEHFLQYSTNHHKFPKNKQKQTEATIIEPSFISLSNGDDDNDNRHQDFENKTCNTKGLRSKVFASWIVETFGCDLLKEGNGILDIAGGKGQLSIELAINEQIPCTIIDPMVRSSMFKKKEMKRLKKAHSPIPIYIPQRFILHDEYNNNQTDDNNIATTIEKYSCYIGLHADECTEDILDAALRYNKSVAIVPCCVFPSFFPMRRLRSKNNKAVNTYDDFLCYLLEKDERLCRDTLDFEGKNQVIYLKQ